MEAKELRIGNLIEYRITDNLDDRKEWWEVSEIDSDDLGSLSNNGSKDDDYRPIPLTVEILLKLGFEKTAENSGNLICFKKSGKYTIAKWNNKWQFWINTVDLYNSPQFVHELQNLIYSLTKQELTFKP